MDEIKNDAQALEAFKTILKNPEVIKTAIQKLIDDEKKIFGESVSQFKDLAEYIKSHWKVIVPAVVVLGLSSFVMDGSMMDQPAKQSKSRINKRASGIDL